MPYAVRSAGGGKFKVINTETGAVHSKATTKANADAQFRLLEGIEHGSLKPRTTREVMGSNPPVQGRQYGKASIAKPRKSSRSRK